MTCMNKWRLIIWGGIVVFSALTILTKGLAALVVLSLIGLGGIIFLIEEFIKLEICPPPKEGP